MPEIYSIALAGIHRGEQKLEHAARKIAQPPVRKDAARNSSTVRDIISIKESGLAIKSNLKLLKTQIQLDKETLDLLA